MSLRKPVTRQSKRQAKIPKSVINLVSSSDDEETEELVASSHDSDSDFDDEGFYENCHRNNRLRHKSACKLCPGGCSKCFLPQTFTQYKNGVCGICDRKTDDYYGLNESNKSVVNAFPSQVQRSLVLSKEELMEAKDDVSEDDLSEDDKDGEYNDDVAMESEAEESEQSESQAEISESESEESDGDE
jgi:hypothetical protein